MQLPEVKGLYIGKLQAIYDKIEISGQYHSSGVIIEQTEGVNKTIKLIKWSDEYREFNSENAESVFEFINLEISDEFVHIIEEAKHDLAPLINNMVLSKMKYLEAKEAPQKVEIDSESDVDEEVRHYSYNKVNYRQPFTSKLPKIKEERMNRRPKTNQETETKDMPALNLNNL